MSKLLYIEASPNKRFSNSITLALKFLGYYINHHPDAKITTLDLWNTRLPEMDGDTLAAKYKVLHGESQDGPEQSAWHQVKEKVDAFKAADKYVFSLPMWNYSIPYKLKHYIDVITQPGLTFSYSPEEGAKGLVTGKPVLLIYASGFAYPKGTDWEAWDYQKPYMESWLRFIGFEDIRSIVIEPTLLGEENKEKAKQEALAKAVKISKSF